MSASGGVDTERVRRSGTSDRNAVAFVRPPWALEQLNLFLVMPIVSECVSIKLIDGGTNPDGTGLCCQWCVDGICAFDVVS